MNNPSKEITASSAEVSEPIYLAHGGSGAYFFQEKSQKQVKEFYELILATVGTVTEINWWAYRVRAVEVIAFDVCGSTNSVDMTIGVTGRTNFPVNDLLANPDCIEVHDWTDAFYLVQGFQELVGLPFVEKHRAVAGLRFSGSMNTR